MTVSFVITVIRIILMLLLGSALNVSFFLVFQRLCFLCSDCKSHLNTSSKPYELLSPEQFVLPNLLVDDE